MSRPALSRQLPRLLAVGVCAVALSGCISLLPKTKPSQLYRFGEPVAAAPAAMPAKTVGVFHANGIFQGESAGDQLLTMTDGKAAYVAQTRWVAPAAVLFDQAVMAAFDANTGPARLIARGEPGISDYSLRLDVRNFETRYDHGPKSAPTVVVRLRGALSRSDRSNIGEKIFEADVPASDDRVGPIVQAYDKALQKVLAQVIDWANAGVAG